MNNTAVHQTSAALVFIELYIPVKAKRSTLPKKERLGMMGLSTGMKPNTIKEALLL
jgi:hypothetical protein